MSHTKMHIKPQTSYLRGLCLKESPVAYFLSSLKIKKKKVFIVGMILIIRNQGDWKLLFGTDIHLQ